MSSYSDVDHSKSEGAGGVRVALKDLDGTPDKTQVQREVRMRHGTAFFGGLVLAADRAGFRHGNRHLRPTACAAVCPCQSHMHGQYSALYAYARSVFSSVWICEPMCV